MPKQVDVEEKRRTLINAAVQLIASEGMAAATMRGVADAAGCTTGTLTHYFANREELLIGVLRAVHNQAGARMRDALQPPGSAAERMRRVLEESLPLDEVSLLEWKVWLTFWASSMTSPVLTAENQRRYQDWRTLLQSLLAELPTSMDVPVETGLLQNFIDGLGITVARQAEPRAMRRAQAECRELLNTYLQRLTA